MNPTIITARVSDQHLQLVNEALIASGGVDVVQIRFEFCGLWDGCGRTAVFYRDPATVYHVPVINGLVTVPHEMLVDEGSFYFGVMGAANNIRTTEVVKVNVVRGAITAATATPEEPAPDIYEQILAAYGRMEQMIYVGSGNMPEGSQIQIDPDGDGGILPIEWGGTGATTAATARTKLGAAAKAHTHSVNDITEVIPVSKGGTGAEDAETARKNLGAAPSGLGLGSVAWLDVSDDMNAITKTGVYAFASSNESVSKPCALGTLVHLEQGGSANIATQIAVDGNYGFPVIYCRKKLNNNWSKWSIQTDKDHIVDLSTTKTSTSMRVLRKWDSGMFELWQVATASIKWQEDQIAGGYTYTMYVAYDDTDAALFENEYLSAAVHVHSGSQIFATCSGTYYHEGYGKKCLVITFHTNSAYDSVNAEDANGFVNVKYTLDIKGMWK